MNYKLSFDFRKYDDSSNQSPSDLLRDPVGEQRKKAATDLF